MSVPIHCPNCSADHLHAAVYVKAEKGDRFQVISVGEPREEDGEQTVTARVNEQGSVVTPEEAHLLCCACDWSDDRFIRWVR